MILLSVDDYPALLLQHSVNGQLNSFTATWCFIMYCLQYCLLTWFQRFQNVSEERSFVFLNNKIEPTSILEKAPLHDSLKKVIPFLCWISPNKCMVFSLYKLNMLLQQYFILIEECLKMFFMWWSKWSFKEMLTQTPVSIV